jgi:hypothetical protein
MTNRGALTAAVKDAATQLGLQLTILEARAAGDFEAAFARLAELHAGALLVSTDPLFTERRDELVSLTALRGSGELRLARVRRRRGPRQLRRQHRRCLSPSRGLCRPEY